MTNVDGSFSPEETQKIIDWLNEHWGASKACEACGHTHWAISTTAASVPALEIKGVSTTSSYGFVMVSCLKCGNTKFLNFNMLGIDWSKAQKEALEKKGEKEASRG